MFYVRVGGVGQTVTIVPLGHNKGAALVSNDIRPVYLSFLVLRTEAIWGRPIRDGWLNLCHKGKREDGAG